MGDRDTGLVWAVVALVAAVARIRPANTRTTAAPGPVPGCDAVFTVRPAAVPARAGRPGVFAPPRTGPPGPPRGVPLPLTC